MSPRYWLWDWLDHNDISSVDVAARALRRRPAIRDLCRRAAEWEPNLREELRGSTVVAGAGADLYTGIQCPNPACQKHQVDMLFRRVWHYFDQIVIRDNLTHDVAHHWGDYSDGQLTERLLTRIDVLLYLREIGADDLVHFREKGINTSDWRSELRRAGLSALAKAGREVLKSLQRDSSIEITVSGATTWVKLNNDEVLGSEIRKGFGSKQVSALSLSQLGRLAINDAWDTEMFFLTEDVVKAKELRSAVGCVHPSHQKVLTEAREVSPGAVAFRLQFPILDGVPIATLLKMRRDDADLFARLQTRLRAAIIEQVGAQPRASSADDLADQIRRDMVEPELRRIRGRLRASAAVLTRKSAVGVALGSLITTCGIIAGAPPYASVLGGAAAIAASTHNAAGKHIEEKRDIELEDLYFIWKAAGHAPGQG